MVGRKVNGCVEGGMDGWMSDCLAGGLTEWKLMDQVDVWLGEWSSLACHTSWLWVADLPEQMAAQCFL